MSSSRGGSKQYRPVPQQDGESEDDEEEIVLYNKRREEEEEEEIVILSPDSGNTRHLKNSGYGPISSRRAACFVILLVGVLMCLITGYALYTLAYRVNVLIGPNSTTTEGGVSFNDWTYQINAGSSELSVHIHDANDDGVPDILIDNVTIDFESAGFHGCPSAPDLCTRDRGHSPCQVRLLALSGRDGSPVWDRWVEYATFAANCREDLNGDGHGDCLFAGRQGAFVAIDVRNDEFLWAIDPNITCPSYNYYYPLYVIDFDEDGVRDIVAIHGGDSFYRDEQKNRTPAFLVVISGKTGCQLSDHIYMPDQRESYSSPVLYTLPNGTEVILFGSGGETISGSLWALSVNSLTKHVSSFIASHRGLSYSINKKYRHPLCLSKDELISSRPFHQKGLYSRDKREEWMEACPLSMGVKPIWNLYGLCMYEFVPPGSAETGVMLPPVGVDIDGDGKRDLVVSQFNDHTLLFDAKMGRIAWNHYQFDTQSYSIPAPLYFNDDDTLDLVLRFNKGKWMDYDYSFIGVLDGKGHGDYLWTLNCSKAVMASPVVLRHRDKGHDAFLFTGTGCNSNRGKRFSRSQRASKAETCRPQRGLKIDQRVCLVEETAKIKRHEDDDFVDLADNIPIPDDIDVGVDLTSYIPKDLWEIKTKVDSFPDPWTEPESFISDYCGFDIETFSTSLYFLTPQLTKKPIQPLVTFKPYIHKPSTSHSTSKRHSSKPTTEDIIQGIKIELSDRKGVRCSHVLAPSLSPGTPAVADFDGDGSLEAVVSVSYSALTENLAVPQLTNVLHPPRVVVKTFNIQRKLEEVYGSATAAQVDFSGFYSIGDQPWTQYMGSDGTAMFNNPRSSS